MTPAVLVLIGTQLVLQSNGNSVSGIQWRGDGQSSAVASKTLTCTATPVPLCLLIGQNNNSVIPDGPVAEGVTSAGVPVASDPSGTAVPVVVLVPPESLTVKGN